MEAEGEARKTAQSKAIAENDLRAAAGGHDRGPKDSRQQAGCALPIAAQGLSGGTAGTGTGAEAGWIGFRFLTPLAQKQIRAKDGARRQ